MNVTIKDTRVAYGVRCLWWDDIRKVGKTPYRNGVSLPCCPICKGMLFEMDSPEIWWRAVNRYQNQGHPGYHDLIEWSQGKCFPSSEAAKNVYEFETGKKVTLK